MTTTTLELPTRFAKLESDISASRGDFALFALFLREDLPDRWDLMIAAPWASEDKKSALEYLITRIKADLGPADLTQLSRIVLIDPAEVSVQNLNRAIHVEHGALEVRDSNFFGLPIKHAFIITSKSPSPRSFQLTPVPRCHNHGSRRGALRGLAMKDKE